MIAWKKDHKSSVTGHSSFSRKIDKTDFDQRIEHSVWVLHQLRAKKLLNVSCETEGRQDEFVKEK